MAAKRVRAIVKGRVQGVFFRAYTHEEAQNLGLSGWVRNLADGSVEAVLEGHPDKVDQMIDWLQVGSPRSAVSQVVVSEEMPTGENTPFAIRY